MAKRRTNPTHRFVCNGRTWSLTSPESARSGVKIAPGRTRDGVYTDILGHRFPVVTEAEATARGWFRARSNPRTTREDASLAERLHRAAARFGDSQDFLMGLAARKHSNIQSTAIRIASGRATGADRREAHRLLALHANPRTYVATGRGDDRSTGGARAPRGAKVTVHDLRGDGRRSPEAKLADLRDAALIGMHGAARDSVLREYAKATYGDRAAIRVLKELVANAGEGVPRLKKRR